MELFNKDRNEEERKFRERGPFGEKYYARQHSWEDEPEDEEKR